MKNQVPEWTIMIPFPFKCMKENIILDHIYHQNSTHLGSYSSVGNRAGVPFSFLAVSRCIVVKIFVYTISLPLRPLACAVQWLEQGTTVLRRQKARVKTPSARSWFFVLFCMLKQKDKKLCLQWNDKNLLQLRANKTVCVCVCVCVWKGMGEVSCVLLSTITSSF